MRSGKLDRTIELRRQGYVDDGYGGQVPGDPVTYATMRAQVVQASTDEYIRDYGTTSETVIVFRTRWLDGVTTADWIGYGGAEYDINETKEIGRRRGLELRCVARA